MSPVNPKTVDEYLEIGCGRCSLGGTPDCKVHNWDDLLAELRKIVLDTDATEEIKWHVPCYTYDGKNLFLMSALKDYCALGFVKGVLLKDPHDVLVQQTENMQATRQLRFTSVEQVRDMAQIIRAYIQEAIEIEKAGLTVEYKKTSDFDMPDELVTAFEDDPKFHEAFEALTPGRQRGYLLHFSGAKQSKTRTSRIEKAMPKIFEGKGFHDR